MSEASQKETQVSQIPVISNKLLDVILRDSFTKACLLQKMSLEDEGSRTSPAKD